ncbi:MAG TPA: hypothetical protein VGO40_02925 [Longimicrobium sp.]|jgi:hypothetical protein|nr:hypothetical protein [Longimicrobium sp.]
MYARPIRRTFALLATAAVVLAGCSSSASFPAELAGSFKLSTANGHALPYTLPGTAAGTTAVLESGTLVILDNGRFDEVLHYKLTTPDFPAGQVTAAETIGDVTISNGQITFKARFEDSYSGTITASTVTYTKASAAVSLTLSWLRGS